MLPLHYYNFWGSFVVLATYYNIVEIFVRISWKSVRFDSHQCHSIITTFVGHKGGGVNLLSTSTHNKRNNFFRCPGCFVQVRSVDCHTDY